MNKFARISRRVIPVIAMAGVGVANAATDLTEITAAKTDALAVAGALLGLSVSVWAALFVKRKFFG